MILALLLISNVAAQDYTPIRKGQVSPIDGTVLSHNALATIITTGDANLAECKAQSELKLKQQQIDCELETQKLEYDLESNKKLNEEIIAAKDLELKKLYDIVKKKERNHAPLWIALGFVGGVATTYGTFYIVENTGN